MNPAQWCDADCLFVFGSLMDTDVLSVVSGIPLSELKLTSATVFGYQQRELVEESYPVLVVCESARASGKLIQGLTVDALQRILFFEGEEYRLQPIDTVTDRSYLQSAFYFRDTGAYTVRQNVWDFERWARLHKPPFLDASREYMNLYGTMTAAEADAYWTALMQVDEGKNTTTAIAV